VSVSEYLHIVHCYINGEYKKKAFRSRKKAEEYFKQITEEGGFCIFSAQRW